MEELLKKMEIRHDELEKMLASYENFQDKQEYNNLAKELASLRTPVGLFRELQRLRKEKTELSAELAENPDDDFRDLAEAEIVRLRDQEQGILAELAALMAQGDDDAGRDVIMEIRAGTGGREAALFAADLYRMYCKYADRKGWKTETMSLNETELGGIKEIVLGIKGRNAYRHLRFESGVHRVQRVPETEAQGRIHTSTATVAVLAEAAEVDMEVEAKDLRIDTYRSSGPGGQHMQKTDSAVRITHLPTGVAVACQDERSQTKNKNKAMRILRARLLDMRQQEEARKLSAERKIQVGSGDRSEKIRTYNFPDRRVTDHRINFTTHRFEAVLEGDLDEISEELIRVAQEKQKEAAESGGI